MMPPVTEAAGSRADLKLIPVEPVAVASLWFPLASTIWNAPEKVPFIGKVKFTLAKLVAPVVIGVTFTQLVKPCG